MDMYPTLPKEWQQWKIEELIGQGSYGIVYRACRAGSDSLSHEECAIKIIRIPGEENEADLVSTGKTNSVRQKAFYKSVADSLINEIHTMEPLKDVPNAVGIREHYIEEAEDGLHWTIFIRMELLTPLTEYLLLEEMDEEAVIKLGADICSVLEVCAEKAIIHRDIKPENIMVDSSGNFKLGDFGIARKIDLSTSGMSLKGTYSYMAPEVYHGEKYDERADQYSLGIVLYKLMNNNRDPFVDADKQITTLKEREEALEKRMEGEVLPPPAYASELLGKIIRKACAYRPEERFATISELKSALIRCRNGETVTVDDFVRLSEQERIQLEKKQLMKKRLLRGSLIAAAAAAVLGTAIFLQTRKTEEEQIIDRARTAEEEIEQTGINLEEHTAEYTLQECTVSGCSVDEDSEACQEALALVQDNIALAEENGDIPDGYEVKPVISYLDDENLLAVAAVYKTVFDNYRNIERAEDDYITYYYQKKNGVWNLEPLENMPETVKNSLYTGCLPAEYADHDQEIINDCILTSAFWIGPNTVFDNAMAVRTGALWQNKDGSVDVYLMVRNGTDKTREESYLWVSASYEDADGNKQNIFSVYADIDGMGVYAEAGSVHGYILHIDAGDILSGTSEWPSGKVSVYASGYNSNYHPE